MKKTQSITLSQAATGYDLAMHARHLSSSTIRNNLLAIRRLQEHLEADLPLKDITKQQVEMFLASLDEFSKKTVLNYHASLSALWTWAVQENLVGHNIIRDIPRPKPIEPDITPFTESDMHALLDAITTSRPYSRPGKRECAHRLPNQERNRAIILMLLDTGLRASELCDLHIHQLDLKNKLVSSIRGKGHRERSLPFSARTGNALWRYLSTRKGDSLGDYLFISQEGEPMDRDRLFKLLASIGKRAGVLDVGPHRFRHTFAINYLRNGGNPWSLQMSLGHSTMDMVRRYLKISQADLSKQHLVASPVDKWRL